MKYLNEGGFESNPLMRLTLGFTLVLLLAFWSTSWLMYFQRMDLTPASVVAYYNGNEADFRAPMSLEGLVETTHMHMPMMGMVLLFLTHLLIFVPLARRLKVAAIGLTFLAALAEEGAAYLVRFVSPGFAWLKIGGLLLLQGVMAWLIVMLAVYLWRSARQQRAALDFSLAEALD